MLCIACIPLIFHTHTYTHRNTQVQHYISILFSTYLKGHLSEVITYTVPKQPQFDVSVWTDVFSLDNYIVGEEKKTQVQSQ